MKILKDLPQGELPQREERLLETFLCVYADYPSLRVDYTEKKRLREKRKIH